MNRANEDQHEKNKQKEKVEVRTPSVKCVPLHGEIVFTQKLRNLLRDKRQSLHLGYTSLGAILKTHWTTVRNWEQGHVVRCQRRNIRRLKDFLLGALDGIITSSILSSTSEREKINRLTHNVLFYYQQIHLEYIYRLSHSPRNEVVAFLHELQNAILEK